MKIITQNRKARHNFFIEDTFEAGIQLRGTEIKSVREGKTNLNDAYVTIKDGELFIVNMHISKYQHSGIFNHDEKRPRKLLMHKRQITRLESKRDQEGYTIIPLKLYFVGSLVKVEIALAKGKKLYDKRETIKQRDQQRRMEKQGIKY